MLIKQIRLQIVVMGDEATRHRNTILTNKTVRVTKNIC